MIARCNAASQFLTPALIFKDVNKNQAFIDGLPPGSDVRVNRISSFISTLIKWFTELFAACLRLLLKITLLALGSYDRAS